MKPAWPSRLSAALLAALFWAPGPAAADTKNTVKSAVHHIPPLAILQDGQPPSGVVVDVLRGSLERAGYSRFEFMTLPFARVHERLERGDVDMAVVARSPERLQNFPPGPTLYHDDLVFITRADHAAVDSFEDGKKLGSVGVVKGSLTDGFLARQGDANLQATPSFEANLKKLEAGHIEAWFVNLSTGVSVLRQAGVPLSSVRIGNAVFGIDFVPIFSPKGDQELPKAVEDGLAALKSDGSYTAILKKYGMLP